MINKVLLTTVVAGAVGLGGCMARDDVAGEAADTWRRQRRHRQAAVPPGPQRPTAEINVFPAPGPPAPANGVDDPPPPVPLDSSDPRPRQRGGPEGPGGS